MTIVNLYTIPLIFGAIYFAMKIVFGQRLGKEKYFENEYANLLYNLSKVAPFKWFIEEDNRHVKALKTNYLINEADVQHLFNYQSLTTLQVFILMIGLSIFAVVALFLEPIINVLSFSLNLDAQAILSDASSMNMTRIIILIIVLLPAIAIRPILKWKASNREIYFIKDLPLLQLFIILMLRSNHTINQVLYILSTTESTYRESFRQAYLIYLRDPHEAFDYLEDVFEGTRLIETIYTLRDYPEYEKNESIQTLENNQGEIKEYTKNARKRIESARNIFATISMSFPFLAVLLLGAGPVAFWALELISVSL